MNFESEMLTRHVNYYRRVSSCYGVDELMEIFIDCLNLERNVYTFVNMPLQI